MPILNYFPTDPRAQTAFQFDHAQAHNSLTWAMNSPTASNLANYLLDPMLGAQIGNTNWAQNHQQAHDDAATWFSVQPSLPFDNVVGTPFWTFVNDQEHSALSGAALVAGLAL